MVWKKEKDSNMRIKNTFVYTRKGVMGRNYKACNAHKLEEHYNYNGSGDDAFGGANEWCVVTLHIGLQEGQEKLRTKLGKELRNFTEKFIKENKLDEVK